MVAVTVNNPQTENEGRRDQYTTYLVSTEKGTSIRRRYSDFQWLYGRLQTEFPGAIVPIIPHKVALTKAIKFDENFIEQRRRHLQRFMDTVVAHEELSRAPSMTPFMLDKFGKEFDHGRKKVELNNPTLITSDEDTTTAAKKVSNMFAKAGTLMGVMAGQKNMMETAEEREVNKLRSYVTEVETQVKKLVKSAETLTNMTFQMAEAVSDMKVPIAEWKAAYQRSSNQSDEITDMMAALLDFSHDYQQLLHIKHNEEQAKFEDAMVRLANDIKAFKIAIKQRKHWQLAYTARLEQISGKEDQIGKATQNLKPPEVTGRLSYERAELIKLGNLEKEKLEQSTTRLLKEAKGAKKRMEKQLKVALRTYGKIQMAFTNRINDAWGQLMPYVEEEEQEENEGATKDNQEGGGERPPPPDAPPPPTPEE